MTQVNKLVSNKILKFLFLLLAFFCLVKAWDYGQASVGFDFYQFWSVGQKVAGEKKINIYSDDFRRRVGSEFVEKAHQSKSYRFLLAADYCKFLGTHPSPFLYSLFGVFSSKDYDRAYTIYQFICMASMVFSFIMLGKLLRFPLVVSLSFLIFFTSYFAPYFSDLRVANVNQVQLGLLVLFLWFQSRYDWKIRDFLGGLVLGGLIMFKLNLVFIPFLLSVSWLINRQYRRMILAYTGMAISVMAALIFSGIFFGSMQCWFDWLKEGIIIPVTTIAKPGNYSFVRLILDCFGMDISKFLIAGFISITALFIWLSRKKELRDDRKISNSDFLGDVLIVGVGCLIYLLSAPLVWLHYYILAIPGFFFILRPRSYFKSSIHRRNTIISYSLAILSMVMISLIPVQALFGPELLSQHIITIVIGVFLLFILMMEELFC